MNRRYAETSFADCDAAEPLPEFVVDAVLAELERILRSSYFRFSRKSSAFLRYIVEKTLNNEAEGLKERTIGIEVFQRDPDYLTNEDPVVRITAGEVRKRIAQYYQTAGLGGPFSIHLSVGSYVPQFVRSATFPTLASELRSQEKDSSGAPPERDISDLSAPLTEPAARIRPRPYLGMLLLIASAASLLLLAGIFGERMLMGTPRTHPARVNVLDVLWRPLLQAPRLVLIYAQEVDFIDGISPEQMSALNGSDHFRKIRLIPTAIMTEIAAASGYLMMHNKPFNVQPSSHITFYDLQAGPFVVFGEPDDPWVRRLTDNLRYHVVQESGGILRIVDRENPELHQWVLDTNLSYANQKRDYAIVARVHDPTTNEYAIVATGLGERGLFAAGRFLRTPEYAHSLVRDASTSWVGRSNVEIVISTSVLDDVIGPPRVEASCSW